MADVVVRGADDLADDDALPRRRAAEDLGLREAAAEADAVPVVVQVRRSLFAMNCMRIVRSSS